MCGALFKCTFARQCKDVALKALDANAARRETTITVSHFTEEKDCSRSILCVFICVQPEPEASKLSNGSGKVKLLVPSSVAHKCLASSPEHTK